MGKKKRYRIRAAKFGNKYAKKYGLTNSEETAEEVILEAPAPATVMAKAVEPEPTVVKIPEPVVQVAVTPAPEIVKEDPVVKAVKATTTRRKATKTAKKPTAVKTETPKKTRRKRTTRAKTTS